MCNRRCEVFKPAQTVKRRLKNRTSPTPAKVGIQHPSGVIERIYRQHEVDARNGPVPRSSCSAVQQESGIKRCTQNLSIGKGISPVLPASSAEVKVRQVSPVAAEHRKVRQVRRQERTKGTKDEFCASKQDSSSPKGYYTNRKLARPWSKESVDISDTLAAIPKRVRTRKGKSGIPRPPSGLKSRIIVTRGE
jgi:hypothetical protein